ncbi:MAG: hypothetical protein A3J29_06295 [Acidobacteria bacterium RIFCSPLOWO2_12_FULL_67_14b]|nr:MAG: hypothetical protein A3J29_06295 [Acidobacteria bacterium RIFCSPLOWO2_12_FULL_67_14b]
MEFKAGDLREFGGEPVSLKVDGREMAPLTRRFTLDAEQGCFARVEIELAATRNLAVSVSADVRVVVLAIPGYVVVSAPQPDGSTHYRLELEAT